VNLRTQWAVFPLIRGALCRSPIDALHPEEGVYCGGRFLGSLSLESFRVRKKGKLREEVRSHRPFLMEGPEGGKIGAVRVCSLPWIDLLLGESNSSEGFSRGGGKEEPPRGLFQKGKKKLSPPNTTMGPSQRIKGREGIIYFRRSSPSSFMHPSISSKRGIIVRENA